MTASRTDSTHLSTSECWTLLEGVRVGRLAVTGNDGMPDIFPVNFIAHEGAIYIRSAPDVKVVRLAADPGAAFEVDGSTDEGWWSVVVRGTASRVEDEVEIERVGARRLPTASPRHKQHVLKLSARTVTGRRFPHRDEVTPEPPKRPASGAEPVVPQRHAGPGAKPDAIPSHPPARPDAPRTG